MDDLLALGPDMHGYVSDAPAHWRHKGVDLYSNMDADVGKKVPRVMHGCWACLFGYATSSTYGSGMGDTAVRFIQEGHGEEFERCARALCVQSGVQPTPLKVMRELLEKKKRYGDDDTVARDRPWGQAPALFGAEVIGLPASFGIKPPEKQ